MRNPESLGTTSSILRDTTSMIFGQGLRAAGEVDTQIAEEAMHLAAWL